MVLIADNEGINKWGYFWENFVRDFFDTTDDTIEFKYGYYRPIISPQLYDRLCRVGAKTVGFSSFKYNFSYR